MHITFWSDDDDDDDDGDDDFHDLRSLDHKYMMIRMMLLRLAATLLAIEFASFFYQHRFFSLSVPLGSFLSSRSLRCLGRFRPWLDFRARPLSLIWGGLGLD